MQKLFIKNMVCNRCIMIVEMLLKRLNIDAAHISLGEIILYEELSSQQKEELSKAFNDVGFEILDKKRSRIIEQIKNSIRELVHHKDNNLKINLSDYLSQKIGLDYSYLTSLFSETEGTTIEKYFIAQKTERVKELLAYDDLSLSEIAFRLNYSSVAHLSSQFKKATGFTPSSYKEMVNKRRKPLDNI